MPKATNSNIPAGRLLLPLLLCHLLPAGVQNRHTVAPQRLNHLLHHGQSTGRKEQSESTAEQSESTTYQSGSTAEQSESTAEAVREHNSAVREHSSAGNRAWRYLPHEAWRYPQGDVIHNSAKSTLRPHHQVAAIMRV